MSPAWAFFSPRTSTSTAKRDEERKAGRLPAYETAEVRASPVDCLLQRSVVTRAERLEGMDVQQSRGAVMTKCGTQFSMAVLQDGYPTMTSKMTELRPSMMIDSGMTVR
jgi:hypothetical protein